MLGDSLSCHNTSLGAHSFAVHSPRLMLCQDTINLQMLDLSLRLRLDDKSINLRLMGAVQAKDGAIDSS